MKGDKKKTWRPNPQTLIGDCEEESELLNEMDDLTQASGNKVRVIDYLLLDDDELESLIDMPSGLITTMGQGSSENSILEKECGDKALTLPSVSLKLCGPRQMICFCA